MTSGLSTLKYLLLAMRPRQWPKNGAIFIGLVFSLNLRRVDMIVTTAAAFVIFCLLSSAVYLVNDLVDCDRDRQHPTKCRRPIASGNLPRPLAVAAAAGIVAVTIPVSILLQPAFGLIAMAYLLLNLMYCFYLKNLVILDVFSLAGGFMLRVVAGAVVISVPISPWLYVCTILGALFLGFNKRRHEIVLLNDQAESHRSILSEYSPALLDQMTTVITSSLIMGRWARPFSSNG